MKRTILAILAAFVFSVCSFAASTGCCGEQDNKKNSWQDKVDAEKIAYLTSAMELTPQEAQAFWPLYNKATKETQEAMVAFQKAYSDMDKAIKEGKSSKEISALVTKYVEAEKASRGVDAKYVPQYLKIISAEKLAKLFVGEEEFRRIQMRRYATRAIGAAKNAQNNKR